MKNTIDLKAERARKAREKFLETWEKISPKLTITGLVDDTIGNVIRHRGSQSLVTATIVAGAVWLFRAVQPSRNHFRFSKTKTKTETLKHKAATLKQENYYENPNPI